MKNQPIPLINGFYADETRPWSQQDVVNWLPCAAEQEGTRTPTMLKTPPGLSPFAQISATTQPVRGIYDAEGRLFTVMGSTLYQVRADGVLTGLGTIPGVGRVKFSHNQITNGNEVLIVNGSAGYIWNTVTSTLTRITDEGYPGAIDAVFIDGYFVQIEPARRFAFNSDLSDGMSYNTLDRFTSEVSPDLLVGMAVSNNELLLLSEGTGEFFENTGASQQPFRSKRITFDKGAASRYGIATLDNTVMWLGSDGVFYLLDGYSPRRISTRPIEQMIRGLNWSQAFAFVWEDSGHSVCYWTFPDGRTIGYDASQQKWHRRASYGFERWRPSCMTRWQNLSIAGDFQAGRLWELDWAYPWEGDVEFVSEMTGPVLHDNQNLVQMPRLEVIMDTGQPEVAVRSFPSAMAVSGDLPSGFVAESGALQYTVVGGSGAKTFSIFSGSLPPGAAMDAAGLVTYTYTTVGNYSWVVRATDALGNTADLNDSAAVTDPADLWLLTYGALPAIAQGGKYSGDSWTALAEPTNPGLLYYFNSQVHLSPTNAASHQYSTNKGVAWTNDSTPSLTAGGGRMATGGGYYFICNGVNYIWRRLTSGGAWADPSGGNSDARSNDAAVAGSTLVVGSTNNNHLSRSIDWGANWSAGATLGAGTSVSSVRLDANSTRAGILYQEDAPNSYTTKIRYSDDAGVTLSAVKYSFPSPGIGNGAGDLLSLGDGRWIAGTTAGLTAYSSDNMDTWTAGPTLGGAINQIAVASTGRVMVACAGGLLYSSDDHGVTFNLRTDPAGAVDIHGVAWTNP